MSDWISIHERFPETSEKVLVTDGEEIDIMRYFGKYKGSPDWDNGTLDVMHWMPLPTLPVPYRTANRSNDGMDQR